jgi:hypothetical protein
MSLLTRKAIILAKTEVTEGVDATPTGAANSILVGNLQPRPLAAEFVDRTNYFPYLGEPGSVLTVKSGELSFEVEIAGAGSAGTVAGYGPLLRACGMDETVNAGVSVVHGLVSDGFESVTIYYNKDGVLHKLLGARGTCVLAFNAKQIPVYRFRFLGQYANAADAAAPTPDYSGFVTPLAVNNVNTPTFSLHGVVDTAAPLEKLEIDLGNNLVYRALVGSESAKITDRRVRASLSFEETSVATYDWWSTIADGTTGALQLIHGTTPGNIVQIDAPNAQITEPTQGDSDGIVMMSCTLRIRPSSAGNDELTITIK